MSNKQLISKQLLLMTKKLKRLLRPKPKWQACLLRSSNNWRLREPPAVRQLLPQLPPFSNLLQLQPTLSPLFKLKPNLQPSK